jgi:hypothetical protein
MRAQVRSPLQIFGEGVTSMTRRGIITCALGVAATSMTLRAQEKKITRKDLPAAVEKTVAEQSHGATIKGFSTEVENGKKIYEVQMSVDGHGRDVSIDGQGHLLEIEDDVAFASLPADIQAGLKKAAGTATLGKIEALTKGGKLVAYESVVTLGGKRHEIQVGPDGKKLSHPE